MGNTNLSFFLISIIGAMLLSIYFFYKNKNLKTFVLILFVLSLSSLLSFLLFYSPETMIERGSNKSNDFYFIIILYTFMILGMISHYLYSIFSIPKNKRGEFDLGLFVAPIFTSPIVFIPLLAALQNTDIKLINLTVPKFMIFFVAFENGFFWREIFENRRRKIKNV